MSTDSVGETVDPERALEIRHRRITGTGGLVGLVCFPLLSARVFASIGSDIIQVLVFLGAIVGAVVVWHGTLSPLDTPGVTTGMRTKITDRLDGIGEELVKLLFFYILAMLMVIAAKAACTVDSAGWVLWAVQRWFLALAGLTVGTAIIGSTYIMFARGMLQMHRNIAYWGSPKQ